MEIPKALAYLGYRDLDAFVPGINDIIKGGYPLPNGEKALSFTEKQQKGKTAKQALNDYQKAMKENNIADAAKYKAILKENYPYFGYGYLETPDQLIPSIPLTFWSFRIMVYIGGFFILFFALLAYLSFKDKLENKKYMLRLSILSIPLAYICSQAGWMVAEIGRQPWAIQDVLPLQASIS